jgi:LPXTG-motif cell wall-anchored protein
VTAVKRGIARLAMLVPTALAMLPIAPAVAQQAGGPFDFFAGDPRITEPTPEDRVESLAPQQFDIRCGETIFFFQEVDPDATDGTIVFEHSFLRETVSDDANFRLVFQEADLVEEDGSPSTDATLATESELGAVPGPGMSGPHDAESVTTTLTDVEAGDRFFVRYEVLVECDDCEHFTGVLQAALESVEGADPDRGRQTIPVRVQCGDDENPPPPPEGAAQITIRKVARGYRAFDFLFEFLDGAPFEFELSGGTQMTFSPLDPDETFVITEDETDEFVLTDITCTGDDADDVDIDLENRTVTIDPDPDDNIICTFTNTPEDLIPNNNPVIPVQNNTTPDRIETLNQQLMDPSGSGAPVTDPAAVDGERAEAMAQLPRTGSDTAVLAAMGLALVAAGTAILLRRRRADQAG